jgi:hypothetical protein
MTLEERLNRLETQYADLQDLIEQFTRDLELAESNLKRGLKYVSPLKQPQTRQEQASILTHFPTDLAELLTAEVKGEYWIIKPHQFLGSENFAKVASVVRGLSGEYVSAGKDSHFRVLVKVTA